VDLQLQQRRHLVPALPFPFPQPSALGCPKADIVAVTPLNHHHYISPRLGFEALTFLNLKPYFHSCADQKVCAGTIRLLALVGVSIVSLNHKLSGRCTIFDFFI
jgi:hypothetical protein